MTSGFENEFFCRQDSLGASLEVHVSPIAPKTEVPLGGFDVCVHDMVRVQACKTPDAAAIVAGARQLSYSELDARANQLAHVLVSSGVTSEVPVGLCLQRSIDLVVGALAILKAGGAYVPVDPSYPVNRIALLLEDSGAPLVIAEPNVAERIPAGNWKSLVLDADELATWHYPEVAPAIETKKENLAYIIFTSGSTGRPKGVQITHANLLNLIGWHQHAFKVTSADRATMHASPGFDAAVWELWPYLVAGASVHVVDDAVRTTPESLRDWMVATGITISFLPTALAESMIDLSWPSQAALRLLLTGADTLRRRPPAGLPFALVNNYGPTECTVVATSGTVQPDGLAEELPAIGRPITNTRVYIVDDQQKLVPAGSPGELLIGGAGVSRGYVNRPESTANKFALDPFSSEDGARIYRTGDIGRLLPDGQIAFMGRIDDQVKIRGYRIEPQEISTALDLHSAIRATCVSTCSDGYGEILLVAYVVLAKDARPTPHELRKFLGESLPDYMVPHIFVRLPALPRLLNGKLDRAALPKPGAENTLSEESFEAPQSPTEQCLAGCLADLFGLRVGVDDNFFEAGGHSLMGAQIVVKIREVFRVELSLRSVFDRPTVRALSAEIERLIHDKLNSISEDEAQQILASATIKVQLPRLEG